jgi:hypothetical protein
MRRRILISAMVSAALATGVNAQTTQAPGTKSKEPASGSEVRMTGCLRSVDGSRDPKSSGTTTAAATPRSLYTLTDATTTSETTPSDRKAAASYQLLAGNQDDFGKYVNSKVEVLGTLSTSSNSGPAVPSTGATSGSTGTAGATGSGATATRETGTTSTLPTLRVRSVRQLASSCMP